MGLIPTLKGFGVKMFSKLSPGVVKRPHRAGTVRRDPIFNSNGRPTMFIPREVVYRENATARLQDAPEALYLVVIRFIVRQRQVRKT